jgi:hypothetical protein
MTYLLYVVGGALSALLVVALVLACLQVVRGARRAPERPADPPADRTSLGKRVGELEADVAALMRRVREGEDASAKEMRRIWGSLAVGRRADRQAEPPVQAELPLADDDTPRILTPELLAQLGGAPAPATPVASPTIGPPPRRKWR